MTYRAFLCHLGMCDFVTTLLLMNLTISQCSSYWLVKNVPLGKRSETHVRDNSNSLFLWVSGFGHTHVASFDASWDCGVAVQFPGWACLIQASVLSGQWNEYYSASCFSNSICSVLSQHQVNQCYPLFSRHCTLSTCHSSVFYAQWTSSLLQFKSK